MRVILSKKGFDTSYGGYPSIIDGTTLINMPIPANGEKYTYGNLKTIDGASLFDTVKPYYKSIYMDNTRQEFTADTPCHPDPNITNYFEAYNFLGSVGQVNQAQRHLENQKITMGDVFIFYGWFREGKGKGKHIAFGYLQIGKIIKTDGLMAEAKASLESHYPWLKDQPHWVNKIYTNNKTNTIYVASENLSFNPTLKGYGIFTYGSDLNLTRPNSDKLREWYIPALSGLTLSCNRDKVAEDGSFSVTATYGQEFVIGESEKAIEWAKNLIKEHAKR